MMTTVALFSIAVHINTADNRSLTMLSPKYALSSFLSQFNYYSAPHISPTSRELFLLFLFLEYRCLLFLFFIAVTS